MLVARERKWAVWVDMETLVGLDLSIPLHPCQGGLPPSNLSSRPERTRISCYAALTDGHVCGFHRMKFANATNLNRKSGAAQGRDLLFA